MAALHGPERIIVRLKRPVQGRPVEGLGLVRMTRRHYRLKVGYGATNEPAFAGEVRVAVGAFSAAAVNG
jgi:hypothetical protein